MKINLHGFGAMRELRGICWEMAAPLTIAELRIQLQDYLSSTPELQALLASCAFASSEQVLHEQSLVSTDCTLNLLPPVCGG